LRSSKKQKKQSVNQDDYGAVQDLIESDSDSDFDGESSSSLSGDENDSKYAQAISDFLAFSETKQGLTPL